jgi:hypothetical protein
MAEPLLDQEGCNLHAARTVVAQAGNGLIAVEFLQPRWNRVHGDLEELEPLRIYASCVDFPSFTHIEHDGGSVRRL